MRFHLKIFHKLFFTLLLLSGVALLLMALFMRWSLDKGFLDYVNTMEETRKKAIVAQLQEEYLEVGSWQEMMGNRRKWKHTTSSAGPPPLTVAEPAPNPPPRPENELRRGRRGSPRNGDGPPGRRGERNGRGPNNGMGPPQRRVPPPSEYDDVLGPIFDDYHPNSDDRHPPPEEAGPPPRSTLYDAERNVIVGPHHLAEQQVFSPIEVKGQLVGWLGVVPLKEVVASQDLSFLKQQSRAIYGFMACLIAFAIIVSLFLTRHLIKPVKSLAGGAKLLSAGEFDTRIPIRGKDEIAQLTADFNNLALTLSENKQARQRWVADISHELRTPLAVLRGELEALQDGIHQWTPATAASLHAEIMGLTKMVEDLFELSLADIGALKYHKKMIDPIQVLDSCTDLLQHRFAERGLELVQPEIQQRTPEILADEQRLRQLYTNVLENACRYTDAGGKCQVISEVKDRQIFIAIEDSYPGISQDKCEQLFERFFRTDSSRSRKHGGAGLGLAICKKIVEAHEGTIQAEPSSLGGLRISMAFPLNL